MPKIRERKKTVQEGWKVRKQVWQFWQGLERQLTIIARYVLAIYIADTAVNAAFFHFGRRYNIEAGRRMFTRAHNPRPSLIHDHPCDAVVANGQEHYFALGTVFSATLSRTQRSHHTANHKPLTSRETLVITEMSFWFVPATCSRPSLCFRI